MHAHCKALFRGVNGLPGRVAAGVSNHLEEWFGGLRMCLALRIRENIIKHALSESDEGPAL